MLTKLLIAWCLMALCVVVHAVGVSSALRWLRCRAATAPGFWFTTWTFVRVAGWMVMFHLVEITCWAMFYYWKEAMPDLPAAFYFSAVTYTTTGYGDLTLPPTWRLVGGVESLTGILMCGWSTGFFFAVVSRLMERAAPTAGAETNDPDPPL